ncbi:hypothetical protein EG68_08222 [Paragonimus skrjabini miyazakii]|uniref:Ubiquitin-like domain-containing protein n=1 Tax=Paragonimus skrjabini miyazakii TaxID=59628 RepID=A0A8S9Y9D1_9TREM|nr:hypothetical protein EG68_08222 [Paragonimus skrjabini miyazakii]
MKLVIQSLKDGRKGTVDVPTTANVLDVKEEIKNMWDIPIDTQHIIVGGDIAIPNRDPISRYGLREGSCLMLSH